DQQQEIFRNMTTCHQDQQQANFMKQRLIVPFRIRNRNWIVGSNWTCCDNLVFFWFGSDMGQNIILELRVAICYWISNWRTGGPIDSEPHLSHPPTEISSFQPSNNLPFPTNVN